MTTPRGPRHDDRRRTFPALSPRPTGPRSVRPAFAGPGAAGPTGHAPEPDGDFAATWWGNAWVESMEDTALDVARLQRGRAYADRGQVDAITVTPGRVMAYVHGSRPRPYRTEIRLRTLAETDWEELLDAAAARPDHIAALLDKDMPHALAESADLLPTAGDLTPDCSCPDDGYPCKHAAALCYQTARLLDEDPFVLFLMRGRGEKEVLADLTRRNATRSAAERATAPPLMPTVRRAPVLRRVRSRSSRRRSPYRRSPAARPSIRRPPAHPTRSRSTSSPPRPRPARTRSSPPDSTPSAHSLPGRTPYGWPPPIPAPG